MMAWMFVAAALMNCAVQARNEETYPVLRTKTVTYTNVTVTTKDKSYIFILHSGGMNSIRIVDLPNDVQEQLGYAVAPDPNLAKTNKFNFSSLKEGTNGIAVFARGLSGLSEKIKPLEADWQARIAQGNVQIDPRMMYMGLGILLVSYLFFCYCSHLICLKAAGSSSILVWVPIFQFIPLLRAAGMSGWWFLISFIPVTQIVWAVNIARTRGKTLWTSFFLVFPVTTVFAYMYLAFSAAAAKPAGPKYKSMSLATA
jgi:hypothetical protein